ncbi:MAG: hypothetical protein HC897_13380 [Thermoanaerobaculia bacterium]|nr:hypothetical protein [Thermoanaerobaculia bacterium]
MASEHPEPLKLFLSYHFPEEQFVQEVCYCLKKQVDLDPFCYAEFRGNDKWPGLIEEKLEAAQVFILFLGSKLGETQEEKELNFILEHADLRRCLVLLDRRAVPPKLRAFAAGVDPLRINTKNPRAAENCAKDIVRAIGRHWISPDGLPIGYPFAYEKDIIETYVGSDEKSRVRLLENGCPAEWPTIDKKAANKDNPIPEAVIGAYRDEEVQVVVDARRRYHDPTKGAAPAAWDLTIPEAGPRALLRYPRNRRLEVGILVSGGIAPGINAVIAGILARHEDYRDWSHRNGNDYVLRVHGYSEAFSGLLHEGVPRLALKLKKARKAANRGGSILATARADELLDVENPKRRDKALETITDRLIHQQIDILYVIGGDGSMRAAHAIARRAEVNESDISVVGIPKTMDNDILWVWQSFGFLSAVEFAKRAILQLHTEVTSNPRLCVIQLFGSDSGFVVSHAALASGVCDAALIPEVDFRLSELSRYICDRLQERRDKNRPYGGIVVLAETAIPLDWRNYIGKRGDGDTGGEKVRLTTEELEAIETFESHGRRVHGQTPDALRSGGLRLVSRILQREIRKIDDSWSSYRVVTNEPRHLIRAIEPSVSDVIFAQRLGTLAVDNAMAGYTDFMISQWLTEYVLVPLKLVVLGRKRVPKDGIFWKSVIASTGQPDFS